MQLQPNPPSPQISTDKLKNYWFRLLSKKQYTQYELVSKAKLKKYTEEEIEQAISEFLALGLIRDDLAADQLAIPLFGRKGKRALSVKLTQKGIKGELAETILSDFKETLSVGLLQTLTRKLAPLEDSYQKKFKAQQFLLSRGYTQLDKHLQTLKDQHLL
jgi:regulatory protein